MILLIVHSFVRFLKYYCQDNIGLHHANAKILILSAIFIGNSFLPLPDSFGHDKSVVLILHM